MLVCSRIREQRTFTAHAAQRLTDGMTMALERAYRQQERFSRETLTEAMQRAIRQRRDTLSVFSASLDGLSPLRRLSGGFGYLTRDGKPVLAAVEVRAGDRIDIRLRDGSVAARAEEIVLRDEP